MARHGDIAWTVIGAGVVGYELWAARRGELLSVAMDRYRRRRPVITHAGIVYIAAHLMRLWPPQVDPLHHLARRFAR